MKVPPCVVDRWVGDRFIPRPKGPLLSPEPGNLVTKDIITIVCSAFGISAMCKTYAMR